jgi:hypothetical protein
MRKLKFALLVIFLLAAIPTLFYAQIKHESTNSQEQKEEILKGKRNAALSCGQNYISVLTVSIAH